MSGYREEEEPSPPKLKLCVRHWCLGWDKAQLHKRITSYVLTVLPSGGTHMPAHGNDLITQLCSPPALACHFTPLQSSLHHLTSSLDLKLNRLQALLHTSAMARPLRSFCLHRIRFGSGSAAPTAAPPSICGAKEGGSSDGGSCEGKSLKGEEAKKKGGTEAAVAVVF